jgi:hypothetical protein
MNHVMREQRKMHQVNEANVIVTIFEDGCISDLT